MKNPGLVGHVDADCFYVSAERARHEQLNAVPVGVLGNQGACVIAKSYELKAAGVTTGMPIWEAVPRCPQAVFIKRDFRWYEVLSRKMLELIRSISPCVEYYSIDEMFFDAGDLQQTLQAPTVTAAAECLQGRIFAEVGIPTSIGISRTRTLAKLMSDANKPFGCCVHVEPDEIDAFIKLQPVAELCGIGRRSEHKLHQHGIRTCGDYAQANRRLIRKLLTIKGEALWWELRGESVVPILSERKKHKAIARGGSIGKPSADRGRIWAWIVRNTERLVEELDFHNISAGQLVLMIDYKASGGWSRAVRFAVATADFETLLKTAHSLFLDNGEEHPQPVTHLHLIAERLCRRGTEQLSLFEQRRGARIDRLKADVNRKSGRFALRSAATLPLSDIYDDAAFNYDICDVHGKTCF